jgi:hypothetical protein
MNKIGVLAYGSLIDNPGNELNPLIVERINCVTPFKVEYARKSRTRGYAPTLIPYEKIGNYVNATILVLKDDIKIETVKDFLWRRETGKIGGIERYSEILKPTPNTVQIKEIKNLKNVQTVLYTSIEKNIDGVINADILSDLAIKSILTKAGEKKNDGIHYLLANKRNGIKTELSEEYEEQILLKTQCNSLEAIDKLLKTEIKIDL